MSKPIGVIACVLGLLACNVEHYDDCNSDDDFDDFDQGPSRPSGGTKATGGDGSGSNTPGGGAGGGSAGGGSAGGGSAGGGSAGGGSAGDDGAAGAPAAMEPPKVPCENERDCTPGFNCNYDVNQCEPADAETCSELDFEADCAARADCIPVYGGTNCSCGNDCECEGGEPGCICESFEFFVCRAAE